MRFVNYTLIMFVLSGVNFAMYYFLSGLLFNFFCGSFLLGMWFTVLLDELTD